MILCDSEILQAVAQQDATFDPEPMWTEQLQPASLDLRLGSSFKIFKMGSHSEDRIIDIRKRSVGEYMRSIDLLEGERFIIESGMFALGTTLEKVSLSSRIVGRIDGRSSWGRMGLTIHNAGYIDPGFEGNITLELINDGAFPLALYPGDRICQISLHTMRRAAAKPYGVKPNSKYQGQTGATASRAHEDLPEEGKD